MELSFWDQRYQETEWAYGVEPNDFLKSMAGLFPLGPVLCLGEGQGRNAVYLASLGHDVEAVDLSASGLARAQALAQERGVSLRTTVADLSTFEMGRGCWSGVISIFCHLPSSLRIAVHQRSIDALVPGGVFLLEAYAPGQLAFKSGGPSDPELLYPLGEFRDSLTGLVWEVARELDREIQEGAYHRGLGAVIQLLGRKL